MDTLKKIISAIFNVEGKDKLRRREMEMILQFKLSWFNPAKAKKVIDSAVQRSLLIPTGEYFSPSQEVKEIKLDEWFRPPEDFNPTDIKIDPVEDLISSIKAMSGLPKQEIVKKGNQMKEKYKVTYETALIMVGYELGIKMDRFVNETYNRLLSEGR